MIDGERGSRICTSADQVSIDTTGACGSTCNGSGRRSATIPPWRRWTLLREAADAFRGDFPRRSRCLRMPCVRGVVPRHARVAARRCGSRSTSRLVDALREEPAEALPYALHRVSLEPLDEERVHRGDGPPGSAGTNRAGRRSCTSCAPASAPSISAHLPSERDGSRAGAAFPPISCPVPTQSNAAEESPAAARPVPPPPEHLPPISADDPPLVGREGERERLIELARLAGRRAAPRRWS
jgi:hypothetical protein